MKGNEARVVFFLHPVDQLKDGQLKPQMSSFGVLPYLLLGLILGFALLLYLLLPFGVRTSRQELISNGTQTISQQWYEEYDFDEYEYYDEYERYDEYEEYEEYEDYEEYEEFGIKNKSAVKESIAMTSNETSEDEFTAEKEAPTLTETTLSGTILFFIKNPNENMTLQRHY